MKIDISCKKMLRFGCFLDTIRLSTPQNVSQFPDYFAFFKKFLSFARISQIPVSRALPVNYPLTLRSESLEESAGSSLSPRSDVQKLFWCLIEPTDSESSEYLPVLKSTESLKTELESN